MDDSRMKKRYGRALKAAVVALAATASAPVVAQSTMVRAQIDSEGPSGVTVLQSVTNPTFAEVGGVQLAYAKARASFGNNGAFASVNNQAGSLGAFGDSIWMDGFTIGGNTGTGLLSISVLVSGTTDGAGQPGGPGSNASYQLFASNAPISCDFEAYSCSGTLLVPLTEGISGSRLFTAQLPFNFGETFYLASYLGVEVQGNGFADFFGSAQFGATAPGNARIAGLSGATYELAAIPTPATGVLFLSGLALLGFMRRKAVGQDKRSSSVA